MKQIDGPKTLLEAIRYFTDEETCFKTLVALRWPSGLIPCPVCGQCDHYFLKTRRVWKCKACKKQFSVKVGTIFEDSPISLTKWLPTLWLICNAKNGISSYEVHRAIGVTQKTAWFMLHRIRLAMKAGSFEKIGGHVEADETYIGGKSRSIAGQPRIKRGRGAPNKTIVFGVLERGERVIATVVNEANGKTLKGLIKQQVEKGSHLYTDAYPAYRGIQSEYEHRIVDHAVEYVRGHIHTNGLENFWSLLKRGIKGTYVSVEPFHLFRYLDEQAFRYNDRRDTDGERFQTVLSQVSGKRVTYNELTGKLQDAN